MRVKYFSLLMCILMTISLTSFGFSSWVITNPPEVVAGEFGTDEVFSAQKYFRLDSIDYLQYCTDGYVNEGLISNTGYMKLHYVIDNIQHFNDAFKDEFNSLKVQFKITFNSDKYNIFETTSLQSSSHEIISESLTITETYPIGKPNNYYSMDLYVNYLNLLPESVSSYEVVLVFKFINNGSFDTIYDELVKLGEKAFSIDIIVSGYSNINVNGGGNSA